MLEVCIPDTSLENCTDLRDKTLKVGMIARALVISRVDRVIIYRTPGSDKSAASDVKLLELLFRYVDTPQYLRRRIYPMIESLKYAGLLPPLRTRAHPLDDTNVLPGEARLGILAQPGLVDIGLKSLVRFDGILVPGQIYTFRVSSVTPTIELELIERRSVPYYFGYETVVVNDLLKYLHTCSNMTRIGLSRLAEPFNSLGDRLRTEVSKTRSLIVLFGGPRHGLFDVFSQSIERLKGLVGFWANTVPDQGTETIRLEEAIPISLAILDYYLGSLVCRPGFYSIK